MLISQLVNHHPKKRKESLSYLAWFLVTLMLLSVGACERCNPQVPQNLAPKDLAPVPKSTILFTVDQAALKGTEETARTFTIHLQHTGDKPSSLDACTLGLILQEKGGAGSSLIYADASNNSRNTASIQQKLTYFTTQKDLSSTHSTLAISFTLQPGTGVNQVIITITLTAPGNVQTGTVIWEVDSKDIVTSQIIQAAQVAGASKDFLELLEKLNQGTHQLTPAEKTEAILDAVSLNNEKVVEALLQVPGVDVNTKDGSGRTPLHRATTSAIAELLLKNGAAVNAKDNNSDTALHFAVLYQHKDIVSLLLQHGADVNAKGLFQNTPLHTAAAGNNNTEIVSLLLEKNADMAITNFDGNTAFQLAKDPKIVSLFGDILLKNKRAANK